MGVTNSAQAVPATLTDTSPEIAVDNSGDDDVSIQITGTALHDGLNANAWGLSKEGATAIAESLVGKDLTASHPQLRGNRYDRSMSGGVGAPIGTVQSAEVISAESAMLDGGEYTVEYSAEILDPDMARKYEAGLFTASDYGVSVGIYAEPESASCSVCGNEMAGDNCDHERFQEVDDEIAGPIYDDGTADHLAAVYLPAYDNADAELAALAGALAEPFDSTEESEADSSEESSESKPDTQSWEYPVRLSDTKVRARGYSGDSPRFALKSGRRKIKFN